MEWGRLATGLWAVPLSLGLYNDPQVVQSPTFPQPNSSLKGEHTPASKVFYPSFQRALSK